MRLDGRLSLVTPEGLRLQRTPAGPASRAAAWALDMVLWLSITLGVAMLLGASELGGGVLLVWLFVSYWGYPVLCEVLWRGQTLGKRVLGLEVIQENGLPVGWRGSLLRNLLLVADFLPLMYVSGLLSMLCDSRFRRLGDRVAETVVVYKVMPTQRKAAAGSETLPPCRAQVALSADQQRVLIDLVERADALPPARLAELAALTTRVTGATSDNAVLELKALVAGMMRG